MEISLDHLSSWSWHALVKAGLELLGLLKLLDLAHHLCGLSILSLGLTAKVFVLLLESLHFLAQIGTVGTAATLALLTDLDVAGIFFGLVT
jgi:hypothetical protein